MNVLVLGATSSIGLELAAAFSPGSRLLLAGRDPERLTRASSRCRLDGAAQVSEIICDLRNSPESLIQAAIAFQPDVLVNAASATSRLRDERVTLDALPGFVEADLLRPLELSQALVSSRPGHPFSIVMISSVLAVVSTPNRTFYSSLKRMQERAFLTLAESNPEVKLLIVRICKTIPPERPSQDAAQLAQAVRASFDRRRGAMSFGLSGRLMLGLYYLQPFIFTLAIQVIRAARNLRTGRRV